MKATLGQVASLILSFPHAIYGTRALDRLYGPSRKNCRRVVLEGLTGTPQRIADCGIGKVSEALYVAFGITDPTLCTAEKEKALDAKVRKAADAAAKELA